MTRGGDLSGGQLQTRALPATKSSIVCLMVPTAQSTPDMGCSLQYGSSDCHVEIGSERVRVRGPKGVLYGPPCPI